MKCLSKLSRRNEIRRGTYEVLSKLDLRQGEYNSMRFIDDIRYIKDQVFTILMNVKSINILVKNMYDKMFDKPKDSDRVKLLEEQVDCLIKNKFEDGKAYDSIVLVPSKKK